MRKEILQDDSAPALLRISKKEVLDSLDPATALEPSISDTGCAEQMGVRLARETGCITGGDDEGRASSNDQT
jgi:hypothetical protein